MSLENLITDLTKKVGDLKKENESLKLAIEHWETKAYYNLNVCQNQSDLISKQYREIESLENAIKAFVDKYFVGGSKADREDYGTRVTAKDIYNFKELLNKDKRN